jgi:hypothetical protein
VTLDEAWEAANRCRNRAHGLCVLTKHTLERAAARSVPDDYRYRRNAQHRLRSSLAMYSPRLAVWAELVRSQRVPNSHVRLPAIAPSAQWATRHRSARTESAASDVLVAAAYRRHELLTRAFSGVGGIRTRTCMLLRHVPLPLGYDPDDHSTVSRNSLSRAASVRNALPR